MSDEFDLLEKVLNSLAYLFGFIVIVAGITIYFGLNWMFVAVALLFAFLGLRYVVDTIAKAITDAAKIARGDKGSEDQE
jgi:hypothetical protein